MGIAFKDQGKLDEAIEAFNKAISLKPEYADAYNNIGIALRDQGKLGEAVDAFNKAISSKPEYADAYNNMGIALKDQGKLDEAIDTYNKAISLKPDSADAYNNIGNALQEQGKLDEAIEAFTKAVSIKLEFAEAYYNIGVTVQDQGKLQEAIDAYRKAISIKPEYAEAYNNMGNALQEQGKLDEAIDAYNKAISSKLEFAEAYNNMGNALKDQGKLDEAVDAYNKAISIQPDYYEAISNIGVTFEDKGQLDDAMEAYKKAISIKPDYAEAWSNSAQALEKWNKLDELEIWLDEAFNSFGKPPADLLFMKCKLLWRYKKYKKTSVLLKNIKFETISLTQRQDYLQLKAKCYEQSKKFKDAYASFAHSNLLVKESKEYLMHKPEQFFQDLKDSLDKLKSSPRVKCNTGSIENLEFSPTFLIGFPRSGTTLLDTILRSNSKIKVVEEQGMLFAAASFLKKNGYNNFVGKITSKNIHKEAKKIYLKELRKHIETNLNDSVCIDKLPLNLLQAPLIHQLFPNAKFILALRHPMDSILSCWMQNFKLNSAMANMVDIDRIVDFYCIAMEIFKICRTNYNLKVHEIRYEDLINNFQSESEAVLKFLNLKWEPEMENYQYTAIKRGRINTPSYSQVVQPIYKDAQYRWLNYREYLEQYLTQVQPWISVFGYD